jgi:recombination protein RecA
MPLRDDARAVMAKLNKQVGDSVFVIASDLPPIPRMTSGSPSLDIMLGGGWPCNQWCEVIGKESSGKTTIIHKTIAANQQRDEDFSTLWVASEGYDEEWAQSLGVDTDRVLVQETNSMEAAYTAMLAAAESRAFDAVVLDSYPALIAGAEDEKGMDEIVVAPGARTTGKFFRKAGAKTKRNIDGSERPLLAIVVNQWRDKIGGFAPHGIVPQYTPGGHAKDYVYYTRLEVSRTEWIDEKRQVGAGKIRVGQVIKLKTIKNKAAPPQQVSTIRFYFDHSPETGLRQGEYDLAKELVALGLLYGVISKRDGGRFAYKDANWHGEGRLLQSIREEPDLADALYAEVLAAAKDTTA